MSTSREIYTPTKWKFVYKTHHLFRIFYTSSDICIQYYLPDTTSEEDLFQSLKKAFRDANINERDIDYMLKDWHENAEKENWKQNRTPIKTHKDNTMGYLGVSIRFNLKSIRIYAQAFRNKKIITKKGQSIKINKVNEDTYSISLGKIKKAFIKACKEADELRGRKALKKEDYLKLMKLPNFNAGFKKIHKARDDTEFDVDFTLTE
jgi:hypothetical protein